jgi:hypothetical protein
MACLLTALVAGQIVPVRGVLAEPPKPTKNSNKQSAGADRKVSGVDDPRSVLSKGEWKRVDDAIDRALVFLASKQQDDGSFPTLPYGQPGVTSLCTMAFLAHGHLPNDGGPYGEKLQQALEYILDSQKESGLISRMAPEGAKIDRNVSHEVGVATAYNHAISGLALSELYGMGIVDKSNRIQHAIAHALPASLEMQGFPKIQPADKGGWRYLNKFNEWESDVSLTSWELMFLRSARNAGFDLPKQPIDDALGYIRRAYTKRYSTFTYHIAKIDTRSRGMAGAGILALAHGGMHESEEARLAGDWLLKQKFDQYNVVETFGQPGYHHDRYHYAVFYACQGMYQLGGHYWKEFFPRIVPTLLDNQRSDGSWDAESHSLDGPYGNAYTTALVVLSLGSPNQLLPIFQR